MKKIFYRNLIFTLFIVYGFINQCAISQPVVGLDNWFNNETNAKTGKSFHYLWTDTEFSGYSRWGEIFTNRGQKLQLLVSLMQPSCVR